MRFAFLLASLVMLTGFTRPLCGAETLGIVSEKPVSGRFVATSTGFMVPYTAKIPNTDVTFEMVPIPAGKFRMGSPETEPGREQHEGPQVEVAVEPFWMGKYEITWDEYKQFMGIHDLFKDFETHKMRLVQKDNMVDAVTAPSNLYEPTFTFQFGEHPRQPAITMTQFAAKQYTKWLSIVSDDFYRLPSSAEWEYACRAGSTDAYSFGNDPEKLGDYAWYSENSDEGTNQVGQKKPNAWGLYDMHGNVAEWSIDEFRSDGYKTLAGKSWKAVDTIQFAKTLYPRMVCGGGWEMDAEECRSASRLGDHEDWKSEDPNFPNSPYWYTTSPGTSVGMRIIRPLNAPETRKEREQYWMTHAPEVSRVVLDRIKAEGRGAIGLVDQKIYDAIKELETKKKNDK